MHDQSRLRERERGCLCWFVLIMRKQARQSINHIQSKHLKKTTPHDLCITTSKSKQSTTRTWSKNIEALIVKQ